MGFVQGLIEDYGLPALHTVEGLAKTGLLGVGAKGAEKAVGHAVPLLGTAIGLIDAAVNTYQAINSQGDKRWDHIGGAVLGALGAIPAVGSYVGAGELAFNGGAAIASAATGHGLGGAEEAGANANQWIGRIGRNLFGDGAAITHQREHEGGGHE